LKVKKLVFFYIHLAQQNRSYNTVEQFGVLVKNPRDKFYVWIYNYASILV